MCVYIESVNLQCLSSEPALLHFCRGTLRRYWSLHSQSCRRGERKILNFWKNWNRLWLFLPSRTPQPVPMPTSWRAHSVWNLWVSWIQLCWLAKIKRQHLDWVSSWNLCSGPRNSFRKKDLHFQNWQTFLPANLRALSSFVSLSTHFIPLLLIVIIIHTDTWHVSYNSTLPNETVLNRTSSKLGQASVLNMDTSQWWATSTWLGGQEAPLYIIL